MSTPNRRADDRPRRLAVMCVFAAIVCSFVAGRLTGRSLAETVRQAEGRPSPAALPEGIDRIHDASEEVTCWIDRTAGSLSCLPDQWLASARLDDQP